jgi:hypothetical protein
MFSRMSEMPSIIIYSGMKINWGREQYRGCCNREERGGLDCLKVHEN